MNTLKPGSEFRLFSVDKLFKAGILFTLLPVLGACGQSEELPPNPQLSVLVERVKTSDYSQTGRLTGEIKPRVQSDLSFQVAGRIAERTVSVGDHVVAGQVLARLDPTEKQADVRAAEAALSAAEAVLRQAQSTFDRQQALLDKKIATRKDYDKAEESLRTAQAAVDVSRTEVETSREQLSYTLLHAEKPGVVTALNVEAGQVVQVADAVYSIAEDGPRDAVFDLDESVLLSDDVAPEIKLVLLSDPTIVAKGIVREVSPTVDQSSGTVRVKVEIVNPPQAMAFGAAVIGEATLQPVKAIVLPSGALFSANGRPAVWLVSLSPISIKAYEAARIVVDDGLKDGQMVVTRGAQLLHPGQNVEAIEEKAQ
jgi:RND family efflux transporter MFP subunit